MIGSILGKKVFVLGIPMWLGVAGTACIKFVSFGKIDLIEKVQRMGEDRSFDHTEATIDFGYQPEPFEEGLRREVAQYLARKHAKKQS